MNFKKRVNGSWTGTPHYIMGTSTDTITTLPAVLYPNGTTATVGLKGDMQQSSQPTPTTPIQPQETGERTGNLFDIGSVTHQTLSPDGTISYTPAMNLSGFIKVNGNYTVSWTAGRNGAYMRVSTYDDNMTFIERVTAINTYTNSQYSNSHSGYIRINYENDHELTNVMLNAGDTALPYEPYGVKIPISSAGQTTPVYLGEVQTTRKIKKLVLTGEETFGYANSCFTYTFDGKPTSVQPIKEVIFSNIYEGVEPKYRDQLRNYQCCITRNYNQIAIRDNNYADATDFKSYLAAQYAAGTPVTVWYVLATEQTGIVNEPLMRIGDYADEVSGISIPVIAGGDTISVDTTLQPSEVTVNYKGWHPVQNVHERDNGAWT